MFEAELREMMATGYALAGRVGYLDGYQLRARADDRVERIEQDQLVQVVGSRSAREVLVRVTEPGRPSPWVVALTRDATLAPAIHVRAGGLYLGGAYRVVETIEDPERAEARWKASELAACWVDEPAPSCC